MLLSRHVYYWYKQQWCCCCSVSIPTRTRGLQITWHRPGIPSQCLCGPVRLQKPGLRPNFFFGPEGVDDLATQDRVAIDGRDGRTRWTWTKFFFDPVDSDQKKKVSTSESWGWTEKKKSWTRTDRSDFGPSLVWLRSGLVWTDGPK